MRRYGGACEHEKALDFRCISLLMDLLTIVVAVFGRLSHFYYNSITYTVHAGDDLCVYSDPGQIHLDGEITTRDGLLPTPQYTMRFAKISTAKFRCLLYILWVLALLADMAQAAMAVGLGIHQ